MSFRILNQAPQYLLPSGKVNAGGRLYFYETDLSTPKDTWSDEALTVLNTNPVLMDAAGRTVTDVLGDGEYGVVMTDAAGVTIWTRNNVRSDAGAGTQIPPLLNGQFLTNDGSVLQWQQIVLLPDLTGTNANILWSDGALPYWAPPPATPEIPDPDIVITTTPNKSVRLGVSDDTTKYLAQFGSDTVAPSGTKTVTKSIVFDAPFSAAPWFIDIEVTSGPATTSGAWPTKATTSRSTTGFTVTFNIPDDDSNAIWQISNTIEFNWKAEGTVVVAP